MEVNTHELAWAAGFYDGEGSTVIGRQGRTPQLRVQLAQIDPQVLERFKAAVGGLGNITGPYKSRSPKHKEKWIYFSSRFEHAQAVIALLWRFLSPVKREQALKAMHIYKQGQDNKIVGPSGVALWSKLAKEGKPLPEGAKLRWPANVT